VSVDATVELDGQYRALREEAGFVDRSERSKLEVRGAGAIDYLQGQLTNDIEAGSPGSGCYAALLDRKGHMQADMRVLLLEGRDVWMDLEPGATETVLRHLRTYSIGREIAIEDVGEQWAITSLIGPRAVEIAGAEGLAPEHAHRRTDRDGIDVLAVATDLGVDLITPSEQRAALAAQLTAAGAPEATLDAAEILRVESGRPRFGREMTTATIPQEAGIENRAVSFTKGCYIGQETVARLHYKGKPNRHLRGLRAEERLADGDAVLLRDREVGRVGTAVISPALGPIALAILRREADPGAEVSVGEAAVPAEVVELPF
jgi:folate-binding protein YgfZ